MGQIHKLCLFLTYSLSDENNAPRITAAQIYLTYLKLLVTQLERAPERQPRLVAVQPLHVTAVVRLVMFVPVPIWIVLSSRMPLICLKSEDQSTEFPWNEGLHTRITAYSFRALIPS